MTSNPATVFAAALILQALIAATGIVAAVKAFGRYGPRTFGRAVLFALGVWAVIGPPVLRYTDRAYRSRLSPVEELRHGAIFENGAIWEYYLLNGAVVAVFLWLLVLFAKRHAA
jgi:hypothetical protein